MVSDGLVAFLIRNAIPCWQIHFPTDFMFIFLTYSMAHCVFYSVKSKLSIKTFSNKFLKGNIAFLPVWSLSMLKKCEHICSLHCAIPRRWRKFITSISFRFQRTLWMNAHRQEREKRFRKPNYPWWYYTEISHERQIPFINKENLNYPSESGKYSIL